MSNDENTVKHGSNPCRAANYPLRSAECGVRSAECGVRSAECGVRSSECGVRNVECGVKRPHLHSPSISSALFSETPSWKASLHIMTGALPQPARHSTNSTVNLPSLVVCGPCACGSRPSLRQKCSCNL